MHDPEGRLLYANAQASDLHGYAAEEFLGLNLRDLLPEGEREGMPARVRRIASDGRASFDVTHRRRDGSALPLHVEARAVEWDGRPAILSVQTDLTERLRDESERLRLITAIEQAAEIIVITDARGTIQYVNPAFTAITGYPRAEALGRNPRILKSGVQDAAFYLNLWQTISAGRTWNGRLVNRRKDGTVYTEDAAISPVRDASGAIVNYVAVKRDITNELSMEAQLRQAQKLEAIGTLASGVAHEINNSIMAVTNFAQLLRDRFAGTDREVEQYAGEIIRETERVADIVRSLLQFARQDKQAHSPARLSDIVRTTLSLMDGVLRHDQITLELDVPDELPKVCCRSQQIQQVLMNLLTNARDALNAKHRGYDSDKVLRITARETAREGCRWIRLTVEDHGTGIPPDVFDRIFDPFFTTKPRDKGTGLGLSISHGIVRDHGGKLHAETEFGHWTRFHVDLPLGGDIEARETGAEAQGTAGGP
jgi:PAS domain S-box-containing protein